MEKYAIASQTSQGCSGFSQEQRGTQELDTWWQGGVRTGWEADAGHAVKPGHPDSPNRLQKSPFLGMASLIFSLFTGTFAGTVRLLFLEMFWPVGPPEQMWLCLLVLRPSSRSGEQ